MKKSVIAVVVTVVVAVAVSVVGGITAWMVRRKKTGISKSA